MEAVKKRSRVGIAEACTYQFKLGLDFDLFPINYKIWIWLSFDIIQQWNALYLILGALSRPK